VELRSAKAEELRELARKFRARAADCPPGYYHDLILQTAGELEELATSLAANGGTELVIFDDDDTTEL
jgi:hypothetical protein